jgi:hypothetical protein
MVFRIGLELIVAMSKLYCILFSVFTLLAHQVSSTDPFDETTTFILAAVQAGPSEGQFVSSGSGLDALKVKLINGLAYDWWYFDPVLDDAEASLVIVFYTVSPAGFPFGSYPSTVDSVSVNAKFRNGTIFTASIPASNATTVTVGGGATGDFEGTGWCWTSTPNMTQYLLNVDEYRAYHLEAYSYEKFDLDDQIETSGQPYIQREPDEQFQHEDAEYPGVVYETV